MSPGRPLLMVTQANEQQTPQTTLVPNDRRLPLNGRIATINTTKPRSPVETSFPQHQLINEVPAKKSNVVSFPVRPERPVQKSSLPNGHDTISHQDSIDSHPSTDDGYSAPSQTRALPSSTRKLPPLPPVRQLPVVKPNEIFFDLPKNHSDDELHRETYPRTGELFYYETSSTSTSPSPSNSHESSVSDQPEEQFQPDDDETSPFEYDA